MKVQYSSCAGLDVHKRTVVACVLTGLPGCEPRKEIKSSGTMTTELLELVEWLKSHGVSHVAMEATGSFWLPIHNLLEGSFELIVANAAHIKAVPGRKTDVGDAEWIADLLRHGLLKASFVPGRAQRDLRELTRHRSALAGKRAQASNELQKALESANIKLQSIVSDITGVSATEMLQEMVVGKKDPQMLAQLARRSLRAKIPALEKALSGELRPHHRLIIDQLLADIGMFAAQIAELDADLQERLQANREDLDRIDEIPGFSRRGAEVVLAEAGSDMKPFPDQHHFSSWSGVCPGQNESAGRHHSGKARKGNRALRSALVQAAHGAIRKKGSYFGALYRRLAARRGKKKAIFAVAHSLAIVVYHLLKNKTHYHELGAQYFDQLNPLRLVGRLTKRLHNLGYQVQLSPIPVPA
jgi:transposase